MRAPLVRRFGRVLAALCLLPLASAAQRDSEFMKEFRGLMQVHGVDQMGKLIQKHEEEAVLAIIETCQAISDGSNDQLEDEIDALGKAWKKTYGTIFVDLEYDYFSLGLKGVFKKQRREVLKRFDLKFGEYSAALAAKDSVKFVALGIEFDAMGDQFSELGDHYMSAKCYQLGAYCFDEEASGKQADFKRTCELLGNFLAERDQIQLKEKLYDQAKARFDKLEYDGYGDPSKGPDARAAAKAEADVSYKPSPIAAAFQLVPDIEAIQRPLFTGDSNFQMWPAVGLREVDSQADFPILEDPPSLLRTGANKASVDLDGDGKGDVDIPLTGKITPVSVQLGAGDAKRPWAFLAVIGQQQDNYQGWRFNLAPDQKNMNLYVGPAASLVGTIGGVRVQVLDDNLDGRYGSEPKDWAYVGTLEGSFQHDIDSVVVGEAKFARPWSRLQKIGEDWYKLEPDPGGKDILASRADVETGTLQLDAKGVPYTWLVVRGVGNSADLMFDVVNGGSNKVEVPTGSYELYCGQVSSGKKAQMCKALVLPGKNSRTFAVGKGGTTKLELGAPFDFDFEVKQTDETVTVEGATVVVTGRGGETYQRLWNCVLAPEVNLRKAGTTRGKKEGKLTPVTSQEELEDQKYDYRTAWFPIGQALQKPSADPYEVQLAEKKNKLFGKIESSWKGK